MARRRRLPTVLQIGFAEKKCARLNENDCTNVDFRALIDEKLTYGENLGVLEAAHPELNWEEGAVIGPKTYEKAQVWEAESLVEPLSYGVIKKSKIVKCERAVKRVGKLKGELKDCQEAPPPPPKIKRRRICKKTEWVPTYEVPGYYRCPIKK